jgi:predicted glycogen debranching enzyme
MNQIVLGRADCGNLEIALKKEWLVTNGLGGYASGTVAGANTRRYHGLLVAALRPPLGRTVMVAKIDGVAHNSLAAYPLVTNEYADGTIDPHGYRFLESFHLDGLIPVWTFALGEAHLEQRIWMEHGHNTT